MLGIRVGSPLEVDDTAEELPGSVKLKDKLFSLSFGFSAQNQSVN